MPQTVILKNNLNAIVDAARRATSEALEEAAEAGVTLAQALCPVKTGNLRGTLTQTVTGRLQREMTEGGPTPESPEGASYALVQNFGSSTQAGKPHFLPGTEEARRVLAQASERKLREALG